MLYKIDKTQGKAYIQLYKCLREEILKGTYPYASRLPSKRLISEEAGISVITVQHAYDILCDEGYVVSRERSGYFVSYKDKDFFAVGKTSDIPLSMVKFQDVGEFPFSVLAKTMRRVLSYYGEQILIKSPNSGCMEFKQAIRDYLSRSRGIKVQPDQIIIGSGAEYLYSMLAQLFEEPITVALEDPSYATIRAVYEANGAKVEMLKMGTEGIETTELYASRANVLHVTPYNSYPTGITASASKRREYVNWATERNGYIIEDDYASEFTVSSKMEDTLYCLDPKEHVIYINTFSKTIAPSFRVGYMILPLHLLERFKKRLGFYSCTVPVFEQYVLANFINDGDFERHINRVRRRLRKEER